MIPSEVLALFALAQQVKILKEQPPLESSVMDIIFPNRPQHPSALIGIKEITDITQTAPVVSRSAPATPIGEGGSSYAFIQPLAVNPSDFISAADLNDLKTWGLANREAWLRRKQDQLRRVCRETTEGIATTALTGTINWPEKLESGGWTTYTIKFGDVLTYELPTKWDAADVTIADVYDTLVKMRKKLRKKGYGGKVEIWAGDDVYLALIKIIDNVKSTVKQSIRFEKVETGIDVAGFLIKPMDETYKNPRTEAAVDKVPPHKMVMIALNAGHACYYCALDDLDAKLQPLPFFLKPVEKKNPSGIDVLGMTKPLPVPNPNGIVWADVVAEAAE